MAQAGGRGLCEQPGAGADAAGAPADCVSGVQLDEVVIRANGTLTVHCSAKGYLLLKIRDKLEIHSHGKVYLGPALPLCSH